MSFEFRRQICALSLQMRGWLQWHRPCNYNGAILRCLWCGSLVPPQIPQGRMRAQVANAIMASVEKLMQIATAPFYSAVCVAVSGT